MTRKHFEALDVWLLVATQSANQFCVEWLSLQQQQIGKPK